MSGSPIRPPANTTAASQQAAGSQSTPQPQRDYSIATAAPAVEGQSHPPQRSLTVARQLNFNEDEPIESSAPMTIYGSPVVGGLCMEGNGAYETQEELARKLQPQSTSVTSIHRLIKSVVPELDVAGNARCWLCSAGNHRVSIPRNEVRIRLVSTYHFKPSCGQPPAPHSFVHLECFIQSQRQQRAERKDNIWIHRWYGEKYEFPQITQPEAQLSGLNDLDPPFRAYVCSAIRAGVVPIAAPCPPIHFEVLEFSRKRRCVRCDMPMSNYKTTHDLRILFPSSNELNYDVYHIVCFFRQQLQDLNQLTRTILSGGQSRASLSTSVLGGKPLFRQEQLTGFHKLLPSRRAYVLAFLGEVNKYLKELTSTLEQKESKQLEQPSQLTPMSDVRTVCVKEETPNGSTAALSPSSSSMVEAQHELVEAFSKYQQKVLQTVNSSQTPTSNSASASSSTTPVSLKIKEHLESFSSLLEQSQRLISDLSQHQPAPSQTSTIGVTGESQPLEEEEEEEEEEGQEEHNKNESNEKDEDDDDDDDEDVDEDDYEVVPREPDAKRQRLSPKDEDQPIA